MVRHRPLWIKLLTSFCLLAANSRDPLTITPTAIESDDSDTTIELDLLTLQKAYPTQYASPIVTVDGQKRKVMVTASGSLSLVITGTEIATAKSTSKISFSISITGTGRVATSTLKVTPTCGTVLSTSTNAFGQIIAAYSNGRYIGSKHSCGDADAIQNVVGRQNLASIGKSSFGLQFQCPELVKRFYNAPTWREDVALDFDGTDAQKGYAAKGLVRFPNDGTATDIPRQGDIVVFQGYVIDPKTKTKLFTDHVGHVAVAASTLAGSIIEQNWDQTGRGTLTFCEAGTTDKRCAGATNTFLARGSYAVLSWLRSTQPPTAGFTMTSGAQSATDGQTLNLIVQTGSTASVTFSAANRSSDPDGTVVFWEWRINGTLVSNAGSFTFALGTGTHRIALIVTDNLGAKSTSAQGVIVVTAGSLPQPPTCNLFASPTTITQGQSSNLTWTTANTPTSAVIAAVPGPDVGPVSPPTGGSTTVKPSSTTTYTLTVQNAGGTNTCQAMVTVNPVTPPTSQIGGGPPGGWVNAVAVDPVNPTIVYAGSGGAGIFKSVNGGQNWLPINSGLPNSEFGLGIAAIAVDPTTPTTLYAALGTGTSTGIFGTSSGIFKTTTAGQTWFSVTTTPLGVGVRTIAIDPKNTAIIYGGTHDGITGILLKSTDGGQSWTSVHIATSNTGIINTLAIDPVNSSVLYAGTGGAYKSTDAGQSWVPINNGLPSNPILGSVTGVFYLAIDPGSSQTLYAGTDHGIFKTTTGGQTWFAINSGLTNQNMLVEGLAISLSNPTTLYAATEDGIFKTTNGGQGWSRSSQVNQHVTSVVLNQIDNLTAYAGTIGVGIFKTDDAGQNWHSSNSGLTNAIGRTVTVDFTSTVYVGANYNGVFKSSDGGQSWIAERSGLPNTNIQTICVDPNNAGTVSIASGFGVFRSTDSGQTWAPSPIAWPGFSLNAIACDPINSLTIYAATQNGLYKSVDGGATWSMLPPFSSSPDMPPQTDVESLAIDPSNSSIIYADTLIYGLFKSTDGGTTWATANTGLADLSQLPPLIIDPKNASTLYTASFGGGVYKSTNGGQSWSTMNAGLSNTSVMALALDPISTSTIYAGTQGGGIFKSGDGGQSWVPSNLGLSTSLIVTSIAVNPVQPTMIYAFVWGAGVFKSADGGATWQPTGAN